MLKNITFDNPEFLWLAVILFVIILIDYKFKTVKNSSFSNSSIKSLNTKSLKVKLFPLLNVLRFTALFMLIVALARPQIIDVSIQTKKSRGIDIVIAVDVSSSMLAQDLKPNRLEALKEVAKEFVNDRINDRIGLVVYAGESYTIASDGQTAFTYTSSSITASNLIVYQNGIRLEPGDYSVGSLTLLLTQGAEVGDSVDVLLYA